MTHNIHFTKENNMIITVFKDGSYVMHTDNTPDVNILAEDPECLVTIDTEK